MIRTITSITFTISNIITKLIKEMIQVNTWSLRSSNNALLIVPSTKTITAARAFHVGLAFPQIWNNLPITIRNATSLH